MKVYVVNAPGFEDFEATVVPGLGRIPAVDDRGDLAIVLDALTSDPYVVPADSLEEIR